MSENTVAVLQPSMVEMSSPPKKLSGKASSAIKHYVARIKRRSNTNAQKGANVNVDTDNATGIKGCVDAVITLLMIYGLDGPDGLGPRSASVKSALHKTIRYWTSMADKLGEFGWIKFAKYKFANFFHHHTHELDIAPPSPFSDSSIDDPRQLCCGVMGRFAISLLRTEHRASFLQSILQLKKGCPRPDKKFVTAEVRKTVIDLTTRQNPKPEQLLIPVDTVFPDGEPEVIWELNQDSCIAQLRRTVRELYHDQTYTDEHRYAPTFPSTSATFADTREDGGQFRSIRKLADDMKLTSYESNAIQSGLGESHIRFTIVGGDEYIGAPRYSVVADVRPLKARYKTLYNEAFRLAMLETPMVTPVGLAEALKARVITKGPPFTAFVMKPLQKFLWRQLKRHPAFRLIGEPVTTWNVLERLGQSLPPGQALLSGDYSAATNNLAPWVSETIAREISAVVGLTADECELFVRSLVGHTFVDDKLSLFVDQKWGQLMGSVTSFPILCIANAAMCRWSLEVAFRKKMSIAQTTIMINGDDCLFRTTQEGLALWKTITTFIGLTPSVGKFFFSREFAQINSANFERVENTDPIKFGEEYDEDGKVYDIMRVNPYRKIGFVNLGLLFGIKRSGEKLGVDAAVNTVNGLGVRCRDMIRQAPPELHANLFRIFVKKHRSILDSVRVPWFMPERWGGLGLPEIAGEDGCVLFGGITDTDLKVAARLHEQPKLYPIRALPAEGTWHTHSYISKRYPVKPTNSNPTQGEKRSFDRLYGLLAVDCLFTVQDLHKEKHKDAMLVLRRNERSWAMAHRSKRWPSALSEDTVRNTNFVSPILDVTIVE